MLAQVSQRSLVRTKKSGCGQSNASMLGGHNVEKVEVATIENSSQDERRFAAT
jgi:hypothetical protein